MKRILGTDGLECMRTYVDASYATHMDMKGHTGGLISIGKEAIHTKYSNQKIHTNISTESEVVGVSDYIPLNLWLMRILKEQGYGMKRAFLSG